MLTIRLEQPGDRPGLRALIEEAFTASELGYHGESELVVALSDHRDDCMSFVAMEDGLLVGQAFFSPVTIHNSKISITGLGLAPMSVKPTHQRHKVGSRMLHDALSRIDAQRFPFVVVLGHPQYYTRFGFESAESFGLRHSFEGIPQKYFFIRLADRSLRTQLDGGVAHYCAEFEQL